MVGDTKQLRIRLCKVLFFVILCVGTFIRNIRTPNTVDVASLKLTKHLKTYPPIRKNDTSTDSSDVTIIENKENVGTITSSVISNDTTLKTYPPIRKNDTDSSGVTIIENKENVGTITSSVISNDTTQVTKEIDASQTDVTDLLLKPYPSPYISYKRNETQVQKFAYAFIVSRCSEDGEFRYFLYDIAISTFVQREAGSTADVVVFIQMAYTSELETLAEQDRLLLDAMDIQVRYIPKTADESFYRTMLDKFLILGLTQYERILFLDGDVVARGNLDYLFDLSIRGVLKRNLIVPSVATPANGGFFMVTPSDTTSDRVMAIIRDKEERGAKLPYPHWDEDVGWGHVFGENDCGKFMDGSTLKKWNYHGAFADQGLLYHWVKYEEKSVSIIFRNYVENWDSDSNGTVYLESTVGIDIFDEYNIDRVCWSNRCNLPFKDFFHFTWKSKPWLTLPPDRFQTDPNSTAQHFWYNTLYILNEKMKLGIDFVQWRHFPRGDFGFEPSFSSASKTSYAVKDNENLTLT